MYLFTKIKPLYFFLAFCVGIFICYVTETPKKIIMRHPTPENAGKVTYQDDDDSCYKYMAKEVKCPDDKGLILEHPLSIE